MNMNEWKAHFRHTAIVFLRRLAPAGNATVYPDDVFLVSYPKSGNTWMRFLVGNLVFPNDPIRFSDVEHRVPSIYGLADRKLRLVPRPRFIKSHEPFHSKYQNVIYVVRDPRDVAVSYYHFSGKWKLVPPGTGMDSFVASFIADELPWRFGTWADHVMSWLAMRPGRPKFLLLRYEDLLVNTQQELSKIASFLEIEATPQALDHAIELSSAGRMRDLEKKEWKKWIGQNRRSRQDVAFVRAAKSKQWMDALSSQSIAAIESAWGPAMQMLGYELVSPPEMLQKNSDAWRLCQAQVSALPSFEPTPQIR